MSTLNVESISHPTSGSNVTINGITPAGTNQLGNRNLIINGAMQVWQRSTSVAGVADGTNEGYQTVDRFHFTYSSAAAGAVTISKSTEVPSGQGFTSSYKVDVTTTATPTANHNTGINHRIEAQNIANSGWNYTSTDSYVTLSFWARSTKAGTYCVSIDSQDAATYEKYVKEYTLAANTWKKVEVTIPGKSTLAYNDDNGLGMFVLWALNAGSNRNQATDATWQTSSDVATSNQVNFFDSTDNSFWLTGVQLEVGSVATPFEHRSYGDELAKCQRYYKRISASSGAAYARMFPLVHMATNTVARCVVTLSPTMRARPSYNQSGTFNTQPSSGSPSFSLDTSGSPEDGTSVTISASSMSGTAGNAITAYANNDASAFVEFSAEL